MVPRLTRDQERKNSKKTIFANVAKFDEKGIAVLVDEQNDNKEAIAGNCPIWHHV